MRKSVFSLIAVVTVAMPVMASAQSWQSVNQRQANLYNRIEQGVRNGGLTRPEARNLRGRFVALERLEARYRSNGLTAWERRDLDRRFDALSREIRYQRRDGQDRRYR